MKVVRFAGASGAGLGLDLLVYVVLSELGVRAGVANVVSAVCGVSLVFVLGAHVVFEGEHRFLRRSFGMYGAYQAAAIALASLAVDTLTTVFDGAYLAAKLVVLPATFAANYVFMSWLLGDRRGSELRLHG